MLRGVESEGNGWLKVIPATESTSEGKRPTKKVTQARPENKVIKQTTAENMLGVDIRLQRSAKCHEETEGLKQVWVGRSLLILNTLGGLDDYLDGLGYIERVERGPGRYTW